jgi:hypothetical protein
MHLATTRHHGKQWRTVSRNALCVRSRGPHRGMLCCSRLDRRSLQCLLLDSYYAYGVHGGRARGRRRPREYRGACRSLERAQLHLALFYARIERSLHNAIPSRFMARLADSGRRIAGTRVDTQPHDCLGTTSRDVVWRSILKMPSDEGMPRGRHFVAVSKRQRVIGHTDGCNDAFSCSMQRQ